MLASDVLAKVDYALNDSNNVSWTEPEKLAWLNDGRREIVRVRPDANTVRESITLAEGTAQTLSSEIVALIDITRNMGSDGSTPGGAITEMEKDRLDRWRPDWHTVDATATAKHFIRNPLTPREFYVYPAQPATPEQVEAIVSKVLADVASSADIVLTDQWVPALVDYVCWMAHSKDSDASDTSKRERHKADFFNRLER